MEIPENRRIEDLDTWLLSNGLRNDIGHQQNGDSNNMRQNQWEEHQKYQELIHKKLFSKFDQNEKRLHVQRQNILNQYNDIMIELIVNPSHRMTNSSEGQLIDETCKHDFTIVLSSSTTATTTNSVIIVPVKPLAESCDTIFALITSSLSSSPSAMPPISSDSLLPTSSLSSKDEERQEEKAEEDQNTTFFSSLNKSTSTKRKRSTPLQFSLELYSLDAIYEFLSIVITKTSSVHNIDDSDILVECCRIAHYLQNQIILNDINDILLNSIDTLNCFSICQLADQLNLPNLFERSMIHMMNTIGDFESNLTASCPQANDCQDSSSGTMEQFITPELQQRILSIKAAIQSSIHSQKNHIYVSSLYEYIAIFAERVQYYTERLEEAKEQLRNVKKGTSLYQDMHSKIIRQEQRVQTLKIALKEQKKLFLSSSTTKTPSSLS